MIKKWDIVSDRDVLNNAFISKTGFDPQNIQSELYIYGPMTTYDNVTVNGVLTTTNTLMWLDGNSDLANQAYTHISNDGSDHSFIDQAVTSVSSPTFTKLTLNGDTNYISNTTMANGFLKISNNLAIDKYEIAFGNDGGMISVVGNNSLGFMVNGHWSFIANTGDYHTDYNIYAGTVQASHFIGIKVEDLPLARWRMAKVLTAPIAQGVETALSTIDAAWTGGWDNNNQVLIVIDGEINAPGIDYTLGTLNTLTFTYDVPTGSTLDIIVF